MTKKHFEAAAKIVKEMNCSEYERALIADCFVDLFQQFNPNFDKEKFLKACYFSGKKQ